MVSLMALLNLQEFPHFTSLLLYLLRFLFLRLNFSVISRSDTFKTLRTINNKFNLLGQKVIINNKNF
jgi:hypothetical protein